MHIWDYKIKKDWQPHTNEEWIWYLQRKINYDDWQGLKAEIIKNFLPKIKIHPGKKLMIESYFKYYGTK